jgi:type I restriction enzyme S subunit
MSNNEISEGFNTTELGHLPDGWEVVRLGDVAKTYSGGTPKRDKQEYWGGVIQWVKSGELNNRKIFSSKEYITEEGLNSSSAKFVEENTLLIAMYGATAGKVGLAKSRFTVNQAICAIVPNKSFNSEFYFYYLMSIRDKILAERFGGAQPNLNQQIIKNLTIPLPPLSNSTASPPSSPRCRMRRRRPGQSLRRRSRSRNP